MNAISSMARAVGSGRARSSSSDEEEARIRAERGETVMERALTPHFQDLAARLQKTLAQHEEEDGTGPGA
ncbi:hypothetical protein [Streptomyces azureus]|uniref:Uncharacterized protein n=1 Tax=Streptomyces azureus TaxID=146537 RepID=A0A0K8PID2_STRAJ|nr:hypothetical protein [Streptomyces azureus]GAP47641.1 uncharacterized protein SAZU_2378 [Streptomyces azureus]